MQEVPLVGQISQTHDGGLLICFQGDSNPIVGAEMAVQRRIVIAAPKIESMTRIANVGLVRITRLDAANCADAVVVQGSVRAHDVVALRTTPQQP
ncbi:MAG: hypothetical protein E6K53_13450 [Gammaproteobacteria bacterium]|nr:MAG: hypothetical protein E6K53_13450 [Gammaproteobacteria bacterium]